MKKSDNAIAKNVVVLGSTGSIGTQTLAVIAHSNNQFNVFGLVANRNVELMFQQCVQFRPQYVVMSCSKAAQQLKQKLSGAGLTIVVQDTEQATVDLARHEDADIVVAAIVGSAGLQSAMAAAQAGKRLLLANKEALVMAGDLFMSAVKKSKTVLMPIDSEHNAIFQSMPDDFLPGQPLPPSIETLILTASGGPFRTLSLNAFATITPEMAVKHPNWVMGQKISVDSATMMNKALEVLEAHFLFGAGKTQLDVVVHPQSIIHSFVRYRDGSLICQMGVSDMRIPIAYGLGWPERQVMSGAENLDLTALSGLDFESPCLKRFPCLGLAYACLDQGLDSMVVLNAANEVAVQAFLAKKITYSSIYRVIDTVMQQHCFYAVNDLGSIIETDHAVRLRAERVINNQSNVKIN